MADTTMLPEPDALPDTVNASGLGYVRHQLAVGAHAAWNARFALVGSVGPTLVVGDYFGAGPPGDFFDVLAIDGDFASGSPREHGYHVLGIATGAFMPVGGSVPADAVTGIFPYPIRLAVADMRSGLSGAALADRMLELIEDAPGKAVLNTSLGGWFCDTPARAAANCTVEHATEEAVLWIERVRGTNPANPAFNLEDKFLHATAASNVEPPPIGALGAVVSSEWNAAALLSPLVDPNTGAVVPNLHNTLVVENFSSTESEPFRPDCISAGSEQGGNIAAIGSPSVHSFISPTATGTRAGTSMATPQVAGLGAFVWSLAPSLSPPQLVALLRRTAESKPGCGNGLVIDAYAAVLAADEGNPAAPVRKAILDAAKGPGLEGSDRSFNELDVELFLEKFAAGDLFGGALEYGRFDLNGDARTGGDERAALDLDVSGSTGIVTQVIENGTVEFDETALTDIEILCYYAYSGLYTPVDPQRRQQLLGLDRCLPIDLDVTFPSTISSGGSAALSVQATRRDLSVGQRGVHLELAATGGTVDHQHGVTDALGLFQTNARLAAGSTQITIEIVAHAGAGGPEIARRTVQASVTEPSPFWVGSISWGATQTGGNFCCSSTAVSVEFTAPGGSSQSVTGTYTRTRTVRFEDCTETTRVTADEIAGFGFRAVRPGFTSLAIHWRGLRSVTGCGTTTDAEPVDFTAGPGTGTVSGDTITWDFADGFSLGGTEFTSFLRGTLRRAP
jgi:hypothetical protein